MSDYIDGLKTFAVTLSEADSAQPVAHVLDLNQYPLAGAQVLDRYRYRITVRGKYPQFQYWLAMPFFAPVPWEADVFYSQPGMKERNISLDWYDAGRELPFIDKVIYSLEKEAIPTWNKFLQGYYDVSGISSDSFDQAIQVGGGGDISLTPELKSKGVHLSTAVSTSIFYMGFNMLDPVVGGDSERARLLRQAIAIAMDYEEYISIFANGRGIAAQSPLPPGIFGFRDGQAGINTYVYDWTAQGAQRKPVAEARRLLAEHHAGVFRTAEPDADNGRLAGEAPLAEGEQHIEEETLDAVDPVAGEQHPVVGPEQPALVNGGDVNPVGVRLEGIFDFRRVHADIIVVVLAGDRMHPVGT